MIGWNLTLQDVLELNLSCIGHSYKDNFTNFVPKINIQYSLQHYSCKSIFAIKLHTQEPTSIVLATVTAL